MTIANELFKIAVNAGILDEGNKVPVSTLKTKVEENGYDWKQYGIDDFKDFLEEQDEFTFETSDDGTDYVIDYHGMPLRCTPNSEGLEMDYFSTMLLQMNPQ